MGRSVYPNKLDSDLELPRVDDNVTEIGGDSINSLRDAIVAIETAVGISPQGNKESLAERVGVAIDSNGNIKASALSSVGLVTLPITNAQISSAAAIQESKLNLDFGTTFLKGRVDSNVTDIAAANVAFNAFVADTLLHFSGNLNRHDGYQIDLDSAIRGATNVETALHTVDNEFVDHRNMPVAAHNASAIFVDSTNFTQISADDVQEALGKLDAVDPGVNDHQDVGHDTAVALNKKAEQGTNGNLVNTTLASTVYQTETALATNILQVMRPNVARVTSNALNLGGLQAGARDKLRIQAGGMDRSVLDVDLNAAPSIIPTSSLDDVVEKINSQAALAANHYPISAYNVDGRLVIAHNIPGEEFTVEILSTVSQSAHAELGFSGLTSTVFNWAGRNHAAYVGGRKITDTKPFLKVRYVHSSGNLDEISPQADDLIQLFNAATSNEARILCNITNHSVTGGDNNGTYYITGFTNSNETMILNTNIPFGTFDIEVPADSVNFNSTGRGQVFDIFLDNILDEDGYDGYGIVTKSRSVEYNTIAGINLVSVSKTFPTSSVQWRVTNNDELQVLRAGEAGTGVTIPSGFVGPLKAFAPDNTNSALFEVTANVSSSTQAATPTAFAGTDNRLYLSSVHYEGNFGANVVNFITDKRQLGTSPETEFTDKLAPASLTDALSDLRNNGVVRGFEVISSTSTTIRLRGGRALVDGNVLDVETQTITIDTFDGDNRLLALDVEGKYRTFGRTEAGFSFAELTAGDSYGDIRGITPILEFGTTLSALAGTFDDRRLLISNIDKRLLDAETSLNNRIDSLESSVGGIQWGFTERLTTEPPGEFAADIQVSSNPGFRSLEEPGFSGNQTTRRFEFFDTSIDAYGLFKPVGMTHINVMAQVEYSDATGTVPFGATGLATVDIGINIITGTGNDGYTENYATVKTIQSTVFPSNFVTEQYVSSIPISTLTLSNNTIFDIVPRIRITGSTNINGGGLGSAPRIKFGKIRVITSSYSVAGSILNQDGTSVPLAATVGNIL
jgi:hypothetical protein